MSQTSVLLLVLASAVLHAGWNALAKSMSDRWVSAGLMGIVNGVLGVALAIVFGLPAVEAWPFIVMSALLQSAYLMLLNSTYAYGDMSRLYPVARGTSPVIVTIVALLFLPDRLTALSLVGSPPWSPASARSRSPAGCRAPAKVWASRC